VIDTNLPPILHRFQVVVRFSLAREECLTLTLSLEVIPADIAINYISLKTRFCGLDARKKYYLIMLIMYIFLATIIL